MSEHAPIREAVVAALETEHGPNVVDEHAAPSVENDETDNEEEVEAQEELSLDESQEEAQDEPQGGEEDEGEQLAPLSPPEHWSQDNQAAFQGLPREAQEVLLQREKDLESDYTAKMQAVAPVKDILERNRSYFESLGASPEAVLDYLINADRTLRTGLPEQKRGALESVAQQYGIDLVSQQAAPQTGQTFYNEMGEAVDVAALVNQVVQPLQQQLGQVTQAVSGFMTQQQANTVAQADAQIQTFRNERDESGNLKHPHFDRLADKITSLAKWQRDNGQTPDLAELYTSVCATDPEARQQMLDAQVSSLNAERKAKVQDKKKAAKAQVTGSRTNAAVGEQTFDNPIDAARAAFAKHSGG